MKTQLVNNETKEFSDEIVALTIEKTYSNLAYYYQNCYSSPSNPWFCEIGPPEKITETQIVKVKYIIPEISSYILHNRKADLTLTKQFYSLYNSYIFKEKEWFTYILHPLLPAIKYANDFNSLSLLAKESSRLGIKKFNLKELAELINENPALKYDPPAYVRNEPGIQLRCSNNEKYKSTVAQYIPSIEEFSTIINKFMLKTYLWYISNKMLPVNILDYIGEFIDSSQPLDTTDVSVLRALVLKHKVNYKKTKCSSFLDAEDIVCSTKDLISIKKLKQQSIQEAENQGIIGPREIVDFDLEDVEDDGNCFYYALANQMKIINNNFIHNVPVGTDLNNSLRLAVQGTSFLDKEWADDSTFDVFVTEFPDVILAVIDTRNPNAGFTLYYMGDDGNVVTNAGDPSLVVPNHRMIIRIAATGNHFMSVKGHPDLQNGALRDKWGTIEILDTGITYSSDTKVLTQDSITINAIFSIKYANPILNHPSFLEILKMAMEKAGKIAIEFIYLQSSETFALSKIETAEKIVDRVIEHNYFLSNKKGQELIHIIAHNFNKKTLLTVLELGRDQDIAEQIVNEVEIQGIKRVVYTLTRKRVSSNWCY